VVPRMLAGIVTNARTGLAPCPPLALGWRAGEARRPHAARRPRAGQTKRRRAARRPGGARRSRSGVRRRWVLSWKRSGRRGALQRAGQVGAVAVAPMSCCRSLILSFTWDLGTASGILCITAR
jgi:hypothetical protein